MQKDTTAWHVKRANELSMQIDEAEQRPTEKLQEFDRIVAWLNKYSSQDWHDLVACPQNW